MKKYYLEIPERELDAQWWRELIEPLNKKEVIIKCEIDDDYVCVSPHNHDYPVFKVQRSWLKEIRQPMTFDEWDYQEDWDYSGHELSRFLLKNNKELYSLVTVLIHKERKKAHEWTIENEKLKHEPRQTCDEYWEENQNKIDVQGRYGEEIFFDGWKACEKNRGYDE